MVLTLRAFVIVFFLLQVHVSAQELSIFGGREISVVPLMAWESNPLAYGGVQVDFPVTRIQRLVLRLGGMALLSNGQILAGGPVATAIYRISPWLHPELGGTFLLATDDFPAPGTGNKTFLARVGSRFKVAGSLWLATRLYHMSNAGLFGKHNYDSNGAEMALIWRLGD